MKELKDKLKDKRIEKGLSRIEASDLLDTKVYNIEAYEQARAEPSLSVIKRMIEVYGINKAKLYSFLFE